MIAHGTVRGLKPEPMTLSSSSEKPLLAAIRGQDLAHPPIWLMRQAGRYLPEYRDVRSQVGGFLDLCYDPERATEVTLQPIRRFGLDAAIIFSDILVLPHALGQAVDFQEGRGPVLHPIRDRAGIARLARQADPDKLSRVYDALSRTRSALPESVTLIGFCGAPWTVACYMAEGGSSKDFAAVKGFAFADPVGFEGLIAHLVDTTASHLIGQIEAGADLVQLFESWAGVLPAPAFERWCVAPVRAIVSRVKARYPDIPIVGFPRGAGLHMAAYASSTGVDVVGLDSTVPTDWAARHIQNQAAVQGNLDPIHLVVGGDAMREAARRIIEDLGRGAFVFNLGHGVIPATPPEHVAELVRYVRGDRS